MELVILTVVFRVSSLTLSSVGTRHLKWRIGSLNSSGICTQVSVHMMECDSFFLLPSVV